ncbi:ankyrin [Cadophora sp. DSE1049]|nr:ankyrin [Cadophora sp. DSE1049]
MPLLRLPNEVLLEVLNGIVEEVDIKSFTLVNKRLYQLSIDKLYISDIRSGENKALFWSVHHRQEATLRRAIRLGADLNVQEVEWPSGLVSKLLPGVCVVQIGYWSFPRQHLRILPLSVAARAGDPAILKLLLDGGARIETCAAFDPTPLDLVIMGGNLEAFHLLFRGTPSELGYANEDEDEVEMYPLHRAAQFHRVEMVRTLLSKGADVDVTCSSGRTPLWYAMRQGCPGVFDRDLNLVEDHGLRFLIQPAMIETAKLLRDAGADRLGRILIYPHDSRPQGRTAVASNKNSKTTSQRRNPPRKCRRLD